MACIACIERVNAAELWLAAAAACCAAAAAASEAAVVADVAVEAPSGRADAQSQAVSRLMALTVTSNAWLRIDRLREMVWRAADE
jgi:hypothetical protein